MRSQLEIKLSLPGVVSGLITCLWGWLGPGAASAAEPAASSYHLDAQERSAIDDALRQGARWLLLQQRDDGSLSPVAEASACPLSVTAVALWALADASPELDASPGISRALAFVLKHRQDDGGIYDPRCGLAVYTSGVAAQALRACVESGGSVEVNAALEAATAFLKGKPAPESFLDLDSGLPGGRESLAAKARSLAEERDGLAAHEQAALDFLTRSLGDRGGERLPRSRVAANPYALRSTTAFSYDDVLPLVYEPLAASDGRARRAREAIQRHYTLERNPDLTQRHGSRGFFPGTQGLFYYYLVLAKTLALEGSPMVRTALGPRTDWVRELKDKLLSLRGAAGNWVNADPRWWESEPVLVTAYALLALRICRDVPREKSLQGVSPTRPELLAKIDTSLQQGVIWLLARQGSDGAFSAAAEPGASQVLPTALALWALSSSGVPVGEGQLLRGCAALFLHRRTDGGIYTAQGAQGVLESQVAAQALLAAETRVASDQVRQFRVELERFLASARQEELRQAARDGGGAVLQGAATLPGPLTEAMSFLNRIRAQPAASTQQVPLSIFDRFTSDNVAIRQARQALGVRSSFAEPPWEALQAFPQARLFPRERTAFLAYLVAARVLALEEVQPPGDRPDGERLARWSALATALCLRQRPQGFWTEAGGEGAADEVLATSYALLALAVCRRPGAE